MAKKFVRGITDIKNINNQDLDTNNVNDLLSDGKHNYIHRKKNDGSEEYHNLTNNLKTIQSDNTDLLSVTNYNNTTNSATLHPKHDAQKEQLLESTDNTILISHGENGTDETTSVDVNLPMLVQYFSQIFQKNDMQAQKESYNHDDAYLETVTKPHVNDEDELDFYLLFNMNEGKTQATFELTPVDVKNFTCLMNDFGYNNKLDINFVVFTLNGQTLSVSTNNATDNRFVTSFSTVLHVGNPGSGGDFPEYNSI